MACRSFQAILDEYPAYPNAAAKLKEARRLRRLNTLYADAKVAEEAGDWGAALSTLENLATEAPDFKDAAARLETARRQKQLADLYEEVRRLYQAEQWQAVVNVFAQLHVLEPGYGDPEGLLARAGREVAALQRRAELDQLYRQAVAELDAGHWLEARRLLANLEEQEPGFREAKRLRERAGAELAREEEARRREEQIASLYEQALGLARAGQWRGVLVKLEEIHALDPQYPDPEGIAAQAHKEIAREEAAAQQQTELAALYAEAVQLVKAEQYQAALEKWGAVQTRDPHYPDRQKVAATAGKKLNDLARAGSPRRQLPRWMVAALGLASLILLVTVGALLIRGGGNATPQSALPVPVAGAVSNPEVLYHDDFDQLSSSEWWYRGGPVKPVDGTLEISGQRPWETYVEYQTPLREGQAVLLLYQFDGDANFVVSLEFGDWGTAGFRRWGIFIDVPDDMETNIYEGTPQIEIQSLGEASPGTWHYLLIAAGQDGEFLMRLWEHDNPSQVTDFRRELGQDWAGLPWYVVIGGGDGKLYFDSFTQIGFSELR
jgi:hypothetical protein